MLSRRDFIRGSFASGVALVTIGGGVNSLLKGSVAFAQENPGEVVPNNGKILVLVQLAGGNDGDRTLVPHGSSAYYSARSATAIAAEDVLSLNSDVGLHPNLTGLKGLWDEGKMAVVQGVGYPDQNFSHFKSMAIWQYADPALVERDGWLGKTLEQLESEEHDPFLGFRVGNSPPPELRTPNIPIPAVRNPADYGFKVAGHAVTPDEARSATLLKLYEEYPSTAPYGVLLETTADSAVSSSQLLAEAGEIYVPAAEYPATPFASGLSLLAQVIVGDLGMRVGHTTLGGFDTHVNEVGAHDNLMTTLDGGITAFYQDLAAHGRADDVIVVTWSEFGRRWQENANQATDHGSANMLFAVGSGIQGGLYGEPPSHTQLIDRGNLEFTTDFRSVYSTIIDRWFGVPSEALLGQQWANLDFIPAA